MVGLHDRMLGYRLPYCKVKMRLIGLTTYQNFKEEKNMSKWKCRVCEYVYDPEKGDPDNGVKPERPLRICPEVGYVHLVVQAKTNLISSVKDIFNSSRYINLLKIKRLF